MRKVLQVVLALVSLGMLSFDSYSSPGGPPERAERRASHRSSPTTVGELMHLLTGG